MAVGVGTLSELALLSARAGRDARLATLASIFAQDKMNALGSESGESEGAFCDYLDSHGQVLDDGGRAAAGTVFIRRWSVSSLAAEPDILLLQVVVSVSVSPSLEARLVDLRARRVGG